jgi:hypothetical protein
VTHGQAAGFCWDDLLIGDERICWQVNKLIYGTLDDDWWNSNSATARAFAAIYISSNTDGVTLNFSPTTTEKSDSSKNF